MIQAWLIRLLGVKRCGAFGGISQHGQRWCLKPFGHYDSCMYDDLPDSPNSQPGSRLRAKFRGWK